MVSPLSAFAGDFSYGIVFESPTTGARNWLVFDDTRVWQHIRTDATGNETVLAQGVVSQLKLGKDEENFIRVISVENKNTVYLNSAEVIQLALSPADLPASAAPFAGFRSNHQTGGVSTTFKNFVVWSLGD
jgi:hypothetical protein